MRSDRSRRYLLWGLYFAFWTLIGLAYADQIQRYMLSAGEPANWRTVLLSSLPDFYVWASLSPLVFLVTRRVPIHGERWVRGLAVHVPLSVAVYVTAILVIIAFDYAFVWGPLDSPFVTVYLNHLARSIWSGMLITWGIIAFCHALVYADRSRRREVEASRLEAQLLQAQLQVLRMQLQPHFLFNTLHAISTLMHRDVDAAERMLIRLADLLRLTLEHKETQEVTLDRELEFLEQYLQIERIRFGDRLQVGVEATEETRSALVPSLLLQPIVENAIKHGISPQTKTGVIGVGASRAGDELVIQVTDNGAGLPSGYRARAREGVGLSTTRLRLERLYGSEQTFEMTNRESGGLRVSIRLPFCEGPSELLGGEEEDDQDADRR